MWNSDRLWFIREVFLPKLRWSFGWETLAAPVVGGVVSKLLGDGGAKAANTAATRLANIQAESGLASLDRNRKVFWPLQDQVVNEAKDAGNLADQERAAGVAGDAVTRGLSDARTGLTRNLQQFGVNPTDGRFADSFAKLELDGAIGDAAARNTARIDARELGFNRRIAASGLGSGLEQGGNWALASASGNMTGLANANFNRTRQQQQDIGYALQPALTEGAKALSGIFNKPKADLTGGWTQVPTSGGLVDRLTRADGKKDGGLVRKYANGGPVLGMGMKMEGGGEVAGPGTETSDSIPAALSDGEFVVNAEGYKMLGKEGRALLKAANTLGVAKRAVREAGLKDARRAA
jgi:hypothetical protein